jgi:DNA-binding XRE family transcriptional regulator
VGGLLRELRRASGYRSVEAAAAVTGAPSSRQTIYAYERGGLTPSLAQFLDLVDFYVLRAPHLDGSKPEDDLRAQGVAAVTRALTLPLYHVAAAQDLVARMQPGARRKR